MAFLIKISKRYSCDSPPPRPLTFWEKDSRSFGAKRGLVVARSVGGYWGQRRAIERGFLERDTALLTGLLFCPQGCRSRRCFRTRRTRSCPGSTAAAAKLAPCSPTHSCLAWRRDSRSSATCPRQSGWSWPQPSAFPRRRWASPEGGPDLCSKLVSSQLLSPSRPTSEFPRGNDPAPLDSRHLQRSFAQIPTLPTSCRS